MFQPCQGGRGLATLSRIKLFYLFHLSKPAGYRPLYEAIHRTQARRILEIGMGDGSRAVQMIQLAQQFCEPRDVLFAGIDLFEARPTAESASLTLINAHRLLKATGATIRLSPGTPYDGLSRSANGLGKMDVLVISPTATADAMEAAWIFIPRLLHNDSLIFLEDPAGGEAAMRLVPHDEVARLARTMRRAA
jgi:hypothetical protein